MKSFKWQVVLVLLLALFLSACGGDASSDNSDDVSESEAEVVETLENAEETESDTTETDETVEDESETDSVDATEADSFVSVTGDDMEDVSLEVLAGGGDYSPISSFYDERAFQITMTPAEGGFFPAITIVGIPRDAEVGTSIPLRYAQTGVACLTFQPEISATTAMTSVSGELTLTDYDGETASGTFEAVLSDEFITCTLSPTDSEAASTEGTVTISGQFTAVSIPAEE